MQGKQFPLWWQVDMVNMCASSSSVLCTTHTYTATETPVQALSMVCLQVRTQAARAVGQAAEVLVPGCTDENGPLQKESCTWDSAHELPAGPRCCMISAMQELKYNHKRHLLLRHQPIHAEAEYQEGKELSLTRRVFSCFLKHHSQAVFLRFLSMMKVIGTHRTICNYKMSLLSIFPMFPFPCCSLWLTLDVSREYPACTYCFAFVFFSLFILLYSWNCFAIWGLRKTWFYGGILKTA